MAKTLHYSQRARVSAPLDEVWALFSNPKNHAAIHPLIQALTIVEEGEGPEAGETFVDFEVVDRVVLLGVLKLPVRYLARMIRQPAKGRLTIRATSLMGLVTEAVWQLREAEGGTELEEYVTLTAPWFLVRYSVRESKRAHARMLQRAVERWKGLDRGS